MRNALLSNFLEKYPYVKKEHKVCFQKLTSLRGQLHEALREQKFEKYSAFLEEYKDALGRECATLNESALLWRLYTSREGSLVYNLEKAKEFFQNVFVPIYRFLSEGGAGDFYSFIKKLNIPKGIAGGVLLFNLSFIMYKRYPFVDDKVCMLLWNDSKFCGDSARAGIRERFKFYFGKDPEGHIVYERLIDYAKRVNEDDLFQFSVLARNFYETSNRYTSVVQEEPCDDSLNNLHRTLLEDKQVILYGPVGTGKTYLAKILATCVSGGSDENVFFVTFHPSYEYEDFVEGIFPRVVDGKLTYGVKDGIFKLASIKAGVNAAKILFKRDEDASKCAKVIGDTEVRKDCVNMLFDCKRWENVDITELPSTSNVVLVIDEINRADLSRVFGELLTLIEKTKRLGYKDCVSSILPYSGERFAVPPNLYIIGTMNSTDRSIALIDLALRRRFAFVHIDADPQKLEDVEIDGLKISTILEKLNDKINSKKGKDFKIGHAYFLSIKDMPDEAQRKDEFVRIWNLKIIPLLEELFYGQEDELSNILGSNITAHGKIREIKTNDDIRQYFSQCCLE